MSATSTGSSASRLLDIVMATPVQRAALELLRATSRQPPTVDAAKEVASEWGDEGAESALNHLESINLVRRVELEVDRPVMFNQTWFHPRGPPDLV